jgi:hypothetical protein
MFGEAEVEDAAPEPAVIAAGVAARRRLRGKQPAPPVLAAAMTCVAYVFAIPRGLSREDALQAGVLDRWRQSQQERSDAVSAWRAVRLQVLQMHRLRSCTTLLTVLPRWRHRDSPLPEACLLLILEYAMPVHDAVMLPPFLRPAVTRPFLLPAFARVTALHAVLVRARLGDQMAEFQELGYFLNTIAMRQPPLDQRLRLLCERLLRGTGMSPHLLTGVWAITVTDETEEEAEEEDKEDDGRDDR